ncbi:PREDICTED: juvenile hormone acid O-methyltransferase-like [Trachymyrmex cornetzi]|uniref:juvenile hormone acid O-methyltransferase-like n=1 Tax=Trachymyrmex cornetzi TaxID=471704 RepID=UPI00084EDF32|nr:PREDICTED: juvenile hormone acid O-methyltransferase-like [Trachymyrmex cornetzi]
MNPAEHASFNEIQKRGVSIAIKEFAKDLKSISGTCMDVGCGPGDITNNMLLPSLDSNAVMIGVDISVVMIEYATKTYYHDTRLKFEVLDIQTKNLPEKFISKFNHIFSFHTLHWCNDIRKVFENMYRMLQSGGTILVLFPASHDTVYEVLKNIAQDSRFAPYLQNPYKYISPFYNSILPNEDLKGLLESVGFNIQHCSLREIDFSEINADTFLSSIMSICSFLDAMPPERKEEFIVEFRREYKNYKCKLYGDNKHDGKKAPILDIHKLLVAYAQKDAQ